MIKFRIISKEKIIRQGQCILKFLQHQENYSISCNNNKSEDEKSNDDNQLLSVKQRILMKKQKEGTLTEEESLMLTQNKSEELTSSEKRKILDMLRDKKLSQRENFQKHKIEISQEGRRERHRLNPLKELNIPNEKIDFEGEAAPSSDELEINAKEDDNLNNLSSSLMMRCGKPRQRKTLLSMSPYSIPFSRPNLINFNKVKPKTLNKIDNYFAEWFIGFSEAQDPFQKLANRPCFTLFHNDLQLFHKIRLNLHFGHLDRIKSVWYVTDDVGLPRIIHLLNENLVFDKTREKFKAWVEEYKKLGTWKEGEDFKVSDKCCWRPQINNKWLIGLLDANLGLFAGRILEIPDYPYFRIDLKFFMLHTNVSFLNYLQKIFNGGEIEEDMDGYYRWTITKKKQHIKLNRYCRLFTALSNKNVNMCRYDRLVNYPINNVKTNKAWDKLKRLVDSMNKMEKTNALNMKFHPYHIRFKKCVEKQISMAKNGASDLEIDELILETEMNDMPMWDIKRKVTSLTVE